MPWISCLLAGSLAAGCGDNYKGAGADASADQLTIVSRSPLPNDDNVWTGDAIVVELSAPVAAGSAPSAVSIEDRVGLLEASVVVDGARLLITLDEVPAMPAVLTVSIDSQLMGAAGETFPGDAWSFAMPAWVQIEPASAQPVDGPIAVTGDPSGRFFVAFAEGASPMFWQLDGRAFTELGAPNDDDVAALAMTMEGGEFPLLAMSRDGIVELHRYEREWQALASAAVSGTPSVIALAGRDEPYLATLQADGDIEVRRLSSNSWTAVGPAITPDLPVTGVALIEETGVPLVAYTDDGGALYVMRLDTDIWTVLGDGPVVDPSADDSPLASDPVLVGRAGTLTVGWAVVEGTEQHVRTAGWDGSGWNPTTVDFDIQNHSTTPQLVLASGDAEHIAWSEASRDSSDVYVAERQGDEWVIHHGPANLGRGGSSPAVATAQGQMVALWRAAEGSLAGGLLNASTDRRPALAERLPAGDCAIDEDAPPSTLADTGCYADVASQTLAPQLVPYLLQSPLWSDGAIKRRFLLLPDGQTIDLTTAGAWQVPIGTLLVKEFWLERVPGSADSRFPVETRFLVKRCEDGDCLEPWQGYSYQWNASGTSASLLDGNSEARVDWTVEDALGDETTHTHIYPSRFQCTRCHNAPAGRVLGLQTGQLNRKGRYGDAIDGQLAVMEAIGLFSDGTRPSELEESLATLAPSLDSTYPVADRARSYLHVNCSHCHRRDPDGERPTIDFRVSAPLLADNICDQLTPGDGEGSAIYLRDMARGAGQMPPLATDLVDDRQLLLTRRWIDEMGPCPPPTE